MGRIRQAVGDESPVQSVGPVSGDLVSLRHLYERVPICLGTLACETRFLHGTQSFVCLGASAAPGSGGAICLFFLDASGAVVFLPETEHLTLVRRLA